MDRAVNQSNVGRVRERAGAREPERPARGRQEKSRGLKFAEACGSLRFSLQEISVKVPGTNGGVSCWGRDVLVTGTECSVSVLVPFVLL